MKKVISIILVVVLLFVCGINASAAGIQRSDTTTTYALEKDFQSNYDYNRKCDKDTGKIIEKYDTQVYGINTINYESLSTSFAKADRISAMLKIKEIYNYATDTEKDLLKNYVVSYAPYTNDSELLEYYEQLCTNTNKAKATFSATTSTRSYNRTAAVSYARQHAFSYNSAFPDLNGLGGDCANFVSQCIHEGGFTSTDGWHCYKKNSTYPSPTTSQQLDYSWDVGGRWISASQFCTWLSTFYAGTTNYEYSVPDYTSNHESIYNNDIYTGDIVQLLKPVNWWYEGYHTMLVVDYDYANMDFIYAAHTNNTQGSKILVNIGNNSYYQNFHLKFYHVNW